MSDGPSLVDPGTGLSRVLREWAGTSLLRKLLTLLLQIGPVLIGAGFLPAALDGSLLARVVVGLAVTAVLAYKVVDVRITRRDDPSRAAR